MADSCAAIITACTSLVACTVQTAPRNCSVQYQAAVQYVIYLRERCSEASGVSENFLLGEQIYV